MSYEGSSYRVTQVMNLFFKSYRIYLIFFLFITFESCFSCGLAQIRSLHFTPWVQEIKLPSLYHDMPNVSFYLDRDGTLLIGKDNGLTILRGEKLDHLALNGPIFVTGDESDTLYYAAKDDAGYLIRKQELEYHITSRKHLIPASQRSFTPNDIVRFKKSLFICSDKGVYQLSDGRARLTPFQADLDQFRIFEDSLYLSLKDGTTLKWSGKNFLPLSNERMKSLPESPFPGKEEWLNRLASTKHVPPGSLLTYYQEKGEIWILSPHSLLRIYYPSPLRTLETDPIKTGRILNSLITELGIFLGTSQGVFLLKLQEAESESWSLQRLNQGQAESVHLLSSAGNQAFAAGQGHLYRLGPKGVEIIEKGNFTGIFALDEFTLVASGSNGLSLFRKDQLGWTSRTTDPALAFSHSFAQHEGQLFFLCRNKVYRFSQNMESTVPIKFHPEILLEDLSSKGQELLLVGTNKVYRYEKNEDTFLPLTDPDLEKGIDLDAYPVLSELGDIINVDSRDSILIITGESKVSLFNLQKLNAIDYKAPVGIELLSQKGSAISLHLTGLSFQNSPEPLFRYRMAAKEWSAWQQDRDLNFKNLKAGEYSIEAVGLDLFGRQTEPAQLSFIIKPPFYTSWYAFIVYGLLFLILLFLLRKWQLLSYQRAESRISLSVQSKIVDLTKEKEKSDQLVADILPEKTASQLKEKGKSKWDKYERATVLFSDIQGFTKIAEEMNPEVLIDELDKFFFHFDSVVGKYNIEKIKTIGDAYMAAGGIPKKNSTNPVEVVLAALEMQSYMQHLKSAKTDIWDLRIGIHTGPVIAGVVGHKKLSYDIWGDTVNTASRMESSGIAGKVNISGTTYGMVKEYFICEYRGKLPVKYKGNIDMYFVNGLRPELSVDLKEIPNKRFFTKLQLLRLSDLEDLVFESILNNLPEYIHYHTLKIAQKVYDQAFLLCRAEEVDQDDRLLIRTAALFLNTGLTQAYNNFENRSAVICREILPDYQYSEKQIDQICNLILATKLPFDPQNRLEKILIDAKMDFIGRPSYSTKIKLLHQELNEAGIKINGQQFKNKQLELLFEFEFYTLSAQRLREVKSTDQISIIEQERWI